MAARIVSIDCSIRKEICEKIIFICGGFNVFKWMRHYFETKIC